MAKSKKDEMEAVLHEIKQYFRSWLEMSGMDEATFLSYRTCKHFRVKLLERPDGISVQITHGEEETPLGLPFFVGFSNSSWEKEQYFENTPLILFYLAGRLDRENTENPVSGSYGPNYFHHRVRKFVPVLLEKRSEV